MSVTDQASELVQAGQMQQAIALLQPHLAAEPTDAPAMVVLITALSSQKRFAEALPLSVKAVGLDPANVDYLIVHAECMVQSGFIAGARKAADRAVRMAPQSFAAHRILAIALSAENDFDAAFETVHEAQQLAADDDASQAEVHTLYAVVLERRRGGLPEALIQARTALEIVPTSEPYRARLARMLLVAKQPWEAVRAASVVPSVAPTTGTARGTLILALMMIQYRLLWWQFGIALVAPMFAFGFFGSLLGIEDDMAPATRVGGAIAVVLTALVVFLLCRKAPLGLGLAGIAWTTIRPFPGAAIALVLQGVVVLAALGALAVGHPVLLAPALVVIIVAGLLFQLSMRPMVAAAEDAFGLGVVVTPAAR